MISAHCETVVLKPCRVDLPFHFLRGPMYQDEYATEQHRARDYLADRDAKPGKAFLAEWK